MALVIGNYPFVLNRIKPITICINWLLSLSCIPTNDRSVKYIVTVSFDYSLRLLLVNKLSFAFSRECGTSSHKRIVAVYHFALIGHHKLPVQIVIAGYIKLNNADYSVVILLSYVVNSAD